MAGTLPIPTGLTDITIRPNFPNVSNTTISGRRKVKSQGDQVWSVNVKYPPLQVLDAKKVFAHIVSQRGSFDTFDVVFDDHHSNTSGALTSQILDVRSPTGLNATTINVRVPTGVGQSPLTLNGALVAGDFIKFSNHSKVYMLTRDLDIASGLGSLYIEPGLYVALPASGVTVTYNSVAFKCYFRDNIQSFANRFLIGNNTELTLEMVESI